MEEKTGNNQNPNTVHPPPYYLFILLFFSLHGPLSELIVLQCTSHCCNVNRLAGVSIWSLMSFPVMRIALILPFCYWQTRLYRQNGRLARFESFEFLPLPSTKCTCCTIAAIILPPGSVHYAADVGHSHQHSYYKWPQNKDSWLLKWWQWLTMHCSERSPLYTKPFWYL